MNRQRLKEMTKSKPRTSKAVLAASVFRGEGKDNIVDLCCSYADCDAVWVNLMLRRHSWQGKDCQDEASFSYSCC